MKDLELNEPNLELDREQFVRLLASHERRVYAYILSLVPNWADADEIFQETNVRLWKDFASFEPNSNFAAWATRVAYFQVLTWRRKAARSHLVFDEEIVKSIAAHHDHLLPMAEQRHRALGDCLQQLSERSRALLVECYAPGARIKEVAAGLHRTQASVYKALQRVRQTLRDCIDRRMVREGFK
jgi:RNA polymerase sigma-70 factor (ECF subfamily)